jgi:integrase/recombinase XerD
MSVSSAERPVSALRQRMLEDMAMRGLRSHTQHDYIRFVRGFAAFLGRSPDTATAEDIRRFQVYQHESGVQPPTINCSVSALRFFFTVTLDRPDLSRRLVLARFPRKLPAVRECRGSGSAPRSRAGPQIQGHPRHCLWRGPARVGSGRLKVDDIDSTRMLIRVEQGKGRKDRNAMLSPQLLTLLRLWWKEGKRRGLMLPHGWLFPGRGCTDPISTRQINRAIHEAAAAAGIRKRVSPHTLRHSFATHLLEQDVDIRVIQVLLGHSTLDTTALYAQVATKTIRSVTSPLERLALLMQGEDPSG